MQASAGSVTSVELPSAATEHDVFAGAAVTIGYVRCAVEDPAFHAPGRVRGHRLVFPCQSVWIRIGRSRRFLSDPGVVEYYNDGDEFSRQALDPRGDRTHWYEIAEADVRDCLRQYDRRAADADAPFRFTNGPTDSRAYLTQHALFRRLVSSDPPGELETSETVFDIFDRVVARAYRADAELRAQPITPDERDMADRAAAVLSQMTSARATVSAIGRAAGVSVFHLSRVFRKVTGATLAKHHLRLRLLASLTTLAESAASIEEVATTHGFAGHSHYTSVFRRTFGVTPSAYRRQPQASGRRARGTRPAFL
jgi:AraC-like DNA-binding protein